MLSRCKVAVPRGIQRLTRNGKENNRMSVQTQMNTLPSEKPTILIVEDDVLLRSLLCTILEESGYKVRSAEDGFTALTQIRTEIPDILLSDLHMPGMSGFELL